MMMKSKFGHWLLGALLAGLVLLTPQYGFQALAQEPGTHITFPAEGETVSGLITVTGTANFDDFVKYEVLLKTGDEFAWGATVYAPVVNGNLARIDTRTFLDGVYQVVVRQVNTDSNYTDFVGPTISIENGLGSPLPHPEIESSFLYAPAEAALARVKNCSGRNLEFDYNSPDGFCSAGDLWIKPKPQDSAVCPSMDILLTPCEYRGTAVGEGEPRGVSYSFVAEAGKIYQVDFPGGDRLYIGEIPADERASTDTGATAHDDSTAAAPPAAAAAPAQRTKAGGDSSASAAPEPDVLPVSGQGQASNVVFITAAVSLIVLLIVGGVVALRRRRLTA